MQTHRDSDFEPFTFHPWMGYVAAAMLLAMAWDSNAPEWMIVRGLGLTVLFASSWAAERRKKIPGSGTSIWELRAAVFAIFCGLLTISLLGAHVLDLWSAWVGK